MRYCTFLVGKCDMRRIAYVYTSTKKGIEKRKRKSYKCDTAHFMSERCDMRRISYIYTSKKMGLEKKKKRILKMWYRTFAVGKMQYAAHFICLYVNQKGCRKRKKQNRTDASEYYITFPRVYTTFPIRQVQYANAFPTFVWQPKKRVEIMKTKNLAHASLQRVPYIYMTTKHKGLLGNDLENLTEASVQRIFSPQRLHFAVFHITDN